MLNVSVVFGTLPNTQYPISSKFPELHPSLVWDDLCVEYVGEIGPWCKSEESGKNM